jgi:hypothetical protein
LNEERGGEGRGVEWRGWEGGGVVGVDKKRWIHCREEEEEEEEDHREEKMVGDRW